MVRKANVEEGLTANQLEVRVAAIHAMRRVMNNEASDTLTTISQPSVPSIKEAAQQEHTLPQTS